MNHTITPGEIWVWCEVTGNLPHPVVGQLLGKGRALADQLGVPLAAVFTRQDESGIEALRRHLHAVADPDRLYCLQARAFHAEEAIAAALANWMKQLRPAIVLAGATARGRSLLPRTAALCGAGLTADCTELSIDDTGRLVQTRPAFGGSILAEVIAPRSITQMATVRPGVFPATPAPLAAQLPECIVFRGDGVRKLPRAVSSRAGQPCEIPLPGQWRELTEVLKALPVRTHCLQTLPELAGERSLHEAQLIVAGGRGVGADGFALLQELSRRLGGTVAASRAAVDAGWQPPARQVGQTGATVSPAVYLAFGISGAGQHLAGIRSSGTIIAINRDVQAPIFSAADYGIVADWREIASALLQVLP